MTHLSKQNGMPPRLRREALIGFVFIAPWLIGFLLLKALPVLAAFIFSLTDFKMLSPETTKFVGLENYARLLKDAEAGTSLFGSLGYFVLTVPLEMLVALALAAVLSSDRIRNKRLWRTLIFMTSIIPATSVFLILLGSLGYLDRLVLQRFELPPLQDGMLLLPLIALWSIGPGFLIISSAIEGVPRELYESARVDGAGPWARFLYITLPMISPAIFFTLVINLTAAFGGTVLLDRGYIMNFSLSPLEGYINQIMFLDADMGYASALAWVSFLIAMTLTVLLFRSSRRWVYFPEDDENAEI
jgi:multiple sugar transport system permease protein